MIAFLMRGSSSDPERGRGGGRLKFSGPEHEGHEKRKKRNATTLTRSPGGQNWLATSKSDEK